MYDFYGHYHYFPRPLNQLCCFNYFLHFRTLSTRIFKQNQGILLLKAYLLYHIMKLSHSMLFSKGILITRFVLERSDLFQNKSIELIIWHHKTCNCPMDLHPIWIVFSDNAIFMIDQCLISYSSLALKYIFWNMEITMSPSVYLWILNLFTA